MQWLTFQTIGCSQTSLSHRWSSASGFVELGLTCLQCTLKHSCRRNHFARTDLRLTKRLSGILRRSAQSTFVCSIIQSTGDWIHHSRSFASVQHFLNTVVIVSVLVIKHLFSANLIRGAPESRPGSVSCEIGCLTCSAPRYLKACCIPQQAYLLYSQFSIHQRPSTQRSIV